MKRIFTQDVHRKDGKRRWKKGEVSSDYPPATWNAIAVSLGMKLDEFSILADGVIETEPGKTVPMSTVVKAKRMKQKMMPRRRPVTSPKVVM